MEKWRVRIARHCVTVASSPVTWLLVALFAVAFYSFSMDAVKNLKLWKDMATLPEPEQCALCTDRIWIKGTYPCLFNLATGEIQEIWVHNKDTCKLTLRSSFATIVTGVKRGMTTVTLSKEPLYINPGLFCRDCRAKIGAVIEGGQICSDGYILADLHDLENIQTYAVTSGAAYEICGYTVKITKEKDGLTVTVTGNSE